MIQADKEKCRKIRTSLNDKHFYTDSACKKTEGNGGRGGLDVKGPQLERGSFLPNR